MQNSFSLPSVDHLIEGVHYTVVDWSFAEGRARDRGLETNMPSRGMPSTFAEDCPEGEKMIFGKCRSTKKDGDWDSKKKTKDEQEGEVQAKKEGSDFKNNKMIKDVKSGKKLGWAMKNGVPTLVEWGSVAGEAKVGPKKPATGSAAAATPKPKEKDKEKPKPQQPASSVPNNADNLVQEEKKRDLLPG